MKFIIGSDHLGKDFAKKLQDIFSDGEFIEAFTESEQKKHISDAEVFFETLAPENFHFLSVHNERPYTKIQLQEGDYLFFGKETSGLPDDWMNRFPERCFTVPMWEKGVRSLNLGSSVAVVVYDGLRQLGKF